MTTKKQPVKKKGVKRNVSVKISPNIIMKAADLKIIFNRANLLTTRYDLSSIVITYPFYAKIKGTRNKQHYPILYGNNNEVVFTGETHKNKNDVVILLKHWFPQIVIK